MLGAAIGVGLLLATPAHSFTRIVPFLVSIYAGYFGAGSGVTTLAIVLITVNAHLPTANALKNMLIGSTLGPRITRRLSPAIMRPTVAAFGLGLALGLWLSP